MSECSVGTNYWRRVSMLGKIGTVQSQPSVCWLSAQKPCFSHKLALLKTHRNGGIVSSLHIKCGSEMNNMPIGIVWQTLILRQ